MDTTVAKRLAETEYGRLVELVEAFDPVDWSRQTDCDEWVVEDMARHLLGNMQGPASMRVMARQMRAAKRWSKERGRPVIDGLTATQIADNASLTHPEIVATLRDTWPRAVRGRFGIPSPIGRLVRLSTDTPAGVERWTLGFLMGTIFTRDTWMHRVDLSRATGRDFTPDAEHDGALIADMVAEWARRHGNPYSLELTGPAGGQFSGASGGPALSLDAVEFARTVAGRASGTGLLATQVAF
ncbi:maleylpyruvate isomerase family mycothiol-dependent enzyme [Tomitella biformata]|uniref:maleylpyruvate isomerase family mycothiol-dependent enzyme n=1 Tax=Tomitella biformata TaxID=630403 RepID=UPI0004AFFADC|nr:maleylpyruvate isomerase family mycothiol-dependent enzyme [Tomitella biformata]